MLFPVFRMIKFAGPSIYQAHVLFSPTTLTETTENRDEIEPGLETHRSSLLVWHVRHRAARANDLHGVAFRLGLFQLLELAVGKFSNGKVLITNLTSHVILHLVFF